MTDESNQRNARMAKNKECNSLKKNTNQPMSFWTEQDVLRYLKLTELPYATVYGDIVPKSKVVGQLAIDEVPTDFNDEQVSNVQVVCSVCLEYTLEKEPNRFQENENNTPKQYDYCIREENGLGLGKVLDFINVKY